ncbi:5-formyltetrahydrofolate cyclo-ligase-like [Leguminivora glycinivorella]|uniref:5-formyltetrahydrofolate cyclo-ligase-like n=1 Tax=Leguminivora glycinivorella TaxID=1035111 RepID=UPI00200EEAB7|nr:5-formyltetrahydrofolate cyclo-ligase-like [Leguminivora glycinivorella]
MSEKKAQPNPLKAKLRLDVDARLAAMTDEDRERQSRIIVSKILAHPKYKSAKRISLFLSLPTEIPTEPILNDILSRGDAAFVPQYGRGQMRMLRVLPGDMEEMVETSWKIKQHRKDAVREDAMEKGLDLVIAPGAAFTRDGRRCGHGGGYYDRYLTALRTQHARVYVMAVAFHQQLYPEVPVDDTDVQVDEVITAE